ncbi:hypothetical protein [Microbacterium lacticum]
MTGVSEEKVRVRFTALLAGASVGLLLGAGYFGWLSSFGSVWVGLRNALQAITAGAVMLIVVGCGVILPVLSLARRKISESRSLFTAVSASAIALLAVASFIAVVSGPDWYLISLGVIMGAWISCAVPAVVLARFFMRRPTSTGIVLAVTGVLALAGGLTVLA